MTGDGYVGSAQEAADDEAWLAAYVAGLPAMSTEDLIREVARDDYGVEVLAQALIDVVRASDTRGGTADRVRAHLLPALTGAYSPSPVTPTDQEDTTA